MVCKVIPSPRKSHRRFVQIVHYEVVRILLRPLNGTLGTENADLQCIVETDSDLTRPIEPFGTTCVVDHDGTVVIEPAPLYDPIESGTERFDAKSGDVRNKVLNMTSDISSTVRSSRQFGIGSPRSLLVP